MTSSGSRSDASAVDPIRSTNSTAASRCSPPSFAPRSSAEFATCSPTCRPKRSRSFSRSRKPATMLLNPACTIPSSLPSWMRTSVVRSPRSTRASAFRIARSDCANERATSFIAASPNVSAARPSTSAVRASLSAATPPSASATAPSAASATSGAPALTANASRTRASTPGCAGSRGTLPESARTVIGWKAFSASRYIIPQVVIPPSRIAMPIWMPRATEKKPLSRPNPIADPVQA